MKGNQVRALAGVLFVVVCAGPSRARAETPRTETLRMRSPELGMGTAAVFVRAPVLAVMPPPPPPPPGLEPEQPAIAPWVWYAAAAACVVGGLAIDLGAGSSSNGKWDVIDFAPIALYGAGAGLVYKVAF